jgi:prephenate dehydrogenase
MTRGHVRIVGAGLIGTSIALGLKGAGYRVSVEDEDLEAEEIAQHLIGVGESDHQPDLIIIATPISTISTLVKEYGKRYPESTVIDIGGLKTEVIREIEGFSDIYERFCSTHPMAGREIAGPLAARGDLFQGRIWITTPTSHTSSLVRKQTSELIASLGGIEVELEGERHDSVIAGISHLPQVLSSLLSLTLDGMEESGLALAGQGLKDVSRLAASDPDLWAELLHANRKSLAVYLDKLSYLLNDLSTSLQNDDLRKTHEMLSLAKENHQRIPGKHGGKKRDYWYLPIVIEDKPGQLAAIFDVCAVVAANVEDLTIEHTPGHETGLVTLALSHEDAIKLFDQLLVDGWKVHLPRESIG